MTLSIFVIVCTQWTHFAWLEPVYFYSLYRCIFYYKRILVSIFAYIHTQIHILASVYSTRCILYRDLVSWLCAYLPHLLYREELCLMRPLTPEWSFGSDILIDCIFYWGDTPYSDLSCFNFHLQFFKGIFSCKVFSTSWLWPFCWGLHMSMACVADALANVTKSINLSKKHQISHLELSVSFQILTFFMGSGSFADSDHFVEGCTCQWPV